jgi:hypothetical protein
MVLQAGGTNGTIENSDCVVTENRSDQFCNCYLEDFDLTFYAKDIHTLSLTHIYHGSSTPGLCTEITIVSKV